MRLTLEQSFWARVEKGDACWRWDGNLNPTHGYGEMQFGPRGSVQRWRAHRLSYVLNKGPIPDGMMVLHSCDNRWCVNPDHLSVGTNADNMRDMALKGRGRSGNGLKSFCKSGHALDEANTIRRKSGGRDCRACRKARPKKSRAEYHRKWRATAALSKHPAKGCVVFYPSPNGGTVCFTCGRPEVCHHPAKGEKPDFRKLAAKEAPKHG